MPSLRVRAASVVAAAAALFPLTAMSASATTGSAITTVLAAPGDAPSTPCVGMVVDSGTGAPVTGCVPFTEGMTGQEALAAAGHKLTFDKNGFICRIDGVPDTCASDNTHYWSYFHRAPGAADDKWAYSEKGAADYTVHPGESEGWAYQNGTQRTPATVAYDTLRAQAAAATTTATGSAAANTGSAAGKDDDGGNATLLVVVVLAVIVLLGVGGFVQRTRSRGNR